MSKTGATEAQIEMAAERSYTETSVMAKELPWERMNPDLRAGLCALMRRDAANWLVPPDHRIVRAADAITPGLRAAIGRALIDHASMLGLLSEYSPKGWDLMAGLDDLALLAAVAEGMPS